MGERGAAALLREASDQPHSSGCWKMPGHHACAIARIERLRSDVVVDAFIARGKMIASLSNQVVQLKRENAALRENFAALTEGPQP